VVAASLSDGAIQRIDVTSHVVLHRDTCVTTKAHQKNNYLKIWIPTVGKSNFCLEYEGHPGSAINRLPK
jgi:hypothetical protein